MIHATKQTGLLRGMATLVAALFTFGRSYRRFDWRTGEHERHTARTADGWNLAVYRYRATGRPHPFPVICSHGMAGTHFIYDLHPRFSLARYLAQHGFDTWLVDLRGRGDSWPDGGPDPHLQWSFDDFVAHDLPATVSRVCELAGAEQAFWLGMEMSGQALYAAAIRGTASRGRVTFRSGARLAGPVLAYGGFRVLESSFRRCNSDPLAVSRYFRNGIPDEATDLVDQFAAWIREGVMRLAARTRRSWARESPMGSASTSATTTSSRVSRHLRRCFHALPPGSQRAVTYDPGRTARFRGRSRPRDGPMVSAPAVVVIDKGLM